MAGLIVFIKAFLIIGGCFVVYDFGGHACYVILSSLLGFEIKGTFLCKLPKSIGAANAMEENEIIGNKNKIK